MQVFRQVGARYGEGQPVTVAEAADGKQDRDDQIADAGWPGGGQVRCSVFAIREWLSETLVCGWRRNVKRDGAGL